MSRRRFGFGVAAVAAVGAIALAQPGAAQAPIEIHWWHALTGANNEVVVKLANDFNASQKAYKVVPTYKGSYADTMNAGIAAFRAGNAPHILQVFEVGTATMMAATGAVKPVHVMMKEAGEKFDPKAYLPTVTGYYSTSKGEMISMPFNSSTMIMWYNKDSFKKAGLDPNTPPKTWPDVFAAATKLQANGHPNCGFSTAWITWGLIEQFSAWHNLPLSTKANGMDGWDTVLKFNTPLLVQHLAKLAELRKTKVFDYSGRTNTGEGRFTSGECPIFTTSSAFYGNVKANAKFDFGMAPLPYYPGEGRPQNSIIGGASLWVMGGKKAAEYKGVAQFFTFLSDTNRQQWLHEVSGYLPITKAAYEQTKKSGFYAKNPGRETPLIQMAGKAPTPNSRGLRLGNMVQLRDVWAEEIESILAGKKSAADGLKAAVDRGNAILRQFERTVKK